MDELFKCRNYREFLRISFPGAGSMRGRRLALAKKLGCQTSFVSLVLTDRSHMNEDMIYATAEFLKMSPQETEFLMCIFHREKAATNSLRSYYDSKIQAILNARQQVSSRLKEAVTVPFEAQAQYYSNWLYSAVHTAVLNPATQTIESISQKLRVSELIVQETLEFLMSWNFVKKTTTGYQAGVNRLHLGKDSPFIVQHHRNWQMESMRSVGERKKEDFNYSGVLSLAEKDIAIIREIMLKTVSRIEEQILPSPDEELVGLSFNVFKY